MDNRAVSPALGYVLTLGITLILVVSLFSTSATLVADGQSRAVESELSVLGNRLAGQLATADSLVRATDAPATVTLSERLPERVAGNHYRLSIEEQSTGSAYYRYLLVLESESAGVSVGIPLKIGTEIQETTLSGGTIQITYDGGTGQLEVTA